MKCPFCNSDKLQILPETDDKGQIYRCLACGGRMHPLESFPILPKTQEPFMRLLHVGGRQNYIGPAQNLLKLYGNAMELYVCEADPEVKNAGIKEDYDTRYGTKVFTLPYCISDKVGKSTFNINKDPDSSSLLKTAERAKNYFNGNIVWGNVTETVKTIKLQTKTVDNLILRKKLPVPHFISLDAQGAESRILKKAKLALAYDTVGVVTEVEFNTLYKGQFLFSEICQQLKFWVLDLFRFYNMETWYPTKNCTLGDGRLTVAEALFLRDWHWYLTPTGNPNFWPLARLIASAIAFNQYSYAYEILEYLNETCPEAWESFAKQNGFWFCDINLLNKMKEGV